MMAYPQRAPHLGQIIPMERRRTMEGKVSGCITGVAQDIESAIIRLQLPGRHQTFLHLLNKATFHVAGFHVQHGEAEHWCTFDLMQWARELGWEKPHVILVRQRLIKAGVILWEADLEHPGQGRIGWNLDTAQWRKTGWGGVRPGSGRPTNNQDGNACLGSDKQFKMVTKIIQDDNDPVFKMITVASYDARREQGWSRPLRKVTKETKEEDANASHARDADAPAPDTMNILSEQSDERKRTPMKVDEQEPAYKIACYFRSSILSYAPDAKVPKATTGDMAKWVKVFRAMLKTDHRKPPDIKRAIDFVKETSFWHPFVLNAAKLREKYDTLLLQSQSPRPGGFTRGSAHQSPLNALVAQTVRRAAPGDDGED